MRAVGLALLAFVLLQFPIPHAAGALGEASPPVWSVGDFWLYRTSDGKRLYRQEVVGIEEVEAAIPSNGTSFPAYRVQQVTTENRSWGNDVLNQVAWYRVSDFALIRSLTAGSSNSAVYLGGVYAYMPPVSRAAWPMRIGQHWAGTYRVNFTLEGETYSEPSVFTYSTIVGGEAVVLVPAGAFSGFRTNGFSSRFLDGEEWSNSSGHSVYSASAGNLVVAWPDASSPVPSELFDYRVQRGPARFAGLELAGWTFLATMGSIAASVCASGGSRLRLRRSRPTR